MYEDKYHEHRRVAKEILESIDGLIDSWVRIFNDPSCDEVKEMAFEKIRYYTDYREKIYEAYPKLRPKEQH